MKNNIITISREYGSGGRDVGRLLAEELGLPVFDKEIMHKTVDCLCRKEAGYLEATKRVFMKTKRKAHWYLGSASKPC